MMRSILILVIIFIFLNMCFAQDIYVILSEETKKGIAMPGHNFFIIDYYPKEVFSDNDYNLTIIFKNLGTEFARDLFLRIYSKAVIAWKDKYFITKKVSAAEVSDMYFGAVLQSENVSITIPIKVLDVPKGMYPVILNLFYKDPYGNLMVENFTIFLNVIPKQSISLIVRTIPSKINYGDDFSLNIFLINDGKNKVEDCSLRIKSKLEGQSKYYVGDILPMNITRIVLPFKANSTGNVMMKLYIYCKGYFNEKIIPIYIFPKKPPIIRISSLDISPEFPLKKKTFTITIVLENYGDMEAKSVRVYVKSPKGFKLRNEYFIGNIAPRDTYTLIIDIKPEVSGTYKLVFDISYFDKFGRNYSTIEYLDVNISETGSSVNLKYVILVLLLIFGLIVYKKFRKK